MGKTGEHYRSQNWLHASPLLSRVFADSGIDGMSRVARLYCTVVIGIAATILLYTLLHLQPTDRVRLVVYILAAAVLATIKLRIPGLTATVSGACIVIFTGVAGLSIGETVLIGFAAGVAQCLWSPTHTPRPVQVIFSLATLVISSAVTYSCYHLLASATPARSPSVLILGEAAIYFLTNTALIAGVLAVTEIRPPLHIWAQLYLWTLPHYAIFAILGAFINDTTPNANWLLWLCAMPVVFYINHARMVRAQHRPIHQT